MKTKKIVAIELILVFAMALVCLQCLNPNANTIGASAISAGSDNDVNQIIDYEHPLQYGRMPNRRLPE